MVFSAHGIACLTLDRALPLNPARRHPAARSNQDFRLHICHALERPEHKTLSLWLARSSVHPTGDFCQDGAPAALVSTCWSPLDDSAETNRSLLHFIIIMIGMQFRGKWCYRHACAAGRVCDVLLTTGANLVRFVLGVHGAQYFVHELIGSWAGTSSHSRMISHDGRAYVQGFASCLVLVHVCSFAYNLWVMG